MADNATQPSQALLDALGLTMDDLGTMDATSVGILNQIQTTLNQLNSDDQANELGNLQAHTSGAFAGGFLGLGSESLSDAIKSKNPSLNPKIQSWLSAQLGGIQSQIPSGYTAPLSNAQQQAIAAAMSQQYGKSELPFGTPNIGPLDPNASASGVVAGPTDADWAALSQIMGTDAKAAYQQHVAQWATAQATQKKMASTPIGQTLAAVAGLVPGLTNAASSFFAPPDPTVWVQQTMQQAQGVWAPLFAAFDASWSSSVNTPMPATVEAQLFTALQGMDAHSQNALLQQMPSIKSSLASIMSNTAAGSQGRLTQIAGLLTTAGVTQTGPAAGLANTWGAEQSTALAGETSSATSAQQNIRAFQSIVGGAYPITPDILAKIATMNPEQITAYADSLPSPVSGVSMGQYQTTVKTLTQTMESLGMGDPSPDQIKQMKNWSSDDITTWADAQPDPQHPGFTYGAWHTVSTTYAQQWMSAFGSPASTKQLEALAGMSAQQVTDYINNSPSHVSGLNIGQYNNYDTLINKVRDDLTPSMGNDFMSQIAQKLTPQQTAAAQATNLAPGAAVTSGTAPPTGDKTI